MSQKTQLHRPHRLLGILDCCVDPHRQLTVLGGMAMLRSGREEGLPYSLSRWTDVPAAKWSWFLDRLAAGRMEGIDPRTGVPSYWSLKPEDTLGLIFWTKDPSNLVKYADLIRPFKVQVHVTVTDWHEEEPGVPHWTRATLEAVKLADRLREASFVWRFSPVPLLSPGLSRGVVERFAYIAPIMSTITKEVFISFLQTNDHIRETRTPEERVSLMRDMGHVADQWGMNVRLCNEDRTLVGVEGLPSNLSSGVCAPPEDFALPGREKPPSEGCGCALAVEAFSINESCVFGCRYCYAADETLSGKKRNTTRRLPLIR